MGALIHVCLCLLVQFIFESYGQNDNRLDLDLDSVIIEALDEKFKRDAKQILLQPYGFPLYNLIPDPSQVPIVQPQSKPSMLATTGPCYNSKGELGKCVAFRQCYPYFKLPVIGNFDSWLLGMYDTCSYYTSQGRQMFGVCCADPQKPAESASTQLPVEESDNHGESNNQEVSNSTSSVNLELEGAKIPNWPPPVPTHPPDHTIPPLPTHPPSPGYPGLDTTSSPPSNGMTTKATVKPVIKPITTKPITIKPITTKPTHRPTSKPTTTQPIYDLPSATCGAKNGFQDQGKIVGGHNAEVNEWPWIAALFNSGRQFCGGSLIDSIHILSAAHCVAHMSSWDVARLTVRLGDHNIKSNSETKHIEKKVKRVVRHRGFDSRTLYNDIAILTLDSPVDFNSVIRPVCLPIGSSKDWSGVTGTVIGWGSLRESGPQPAILQEVNIPIWSNQECKQKYGHAAPGGIVDHMLCAGRANKDSCSGDSGGPLMVNNGKWTQVGIVSWGIGCGKGQYPGVYTRVERFLPWITKNLKQ